MTMPPSHLQPPLELAAAVLGWMRDIGGMHLHLPRQLAGMMHLRSLRTHGEEHLAAGAVVDLRGSAAGPRTSDVEHQSEQG